MRTGLKAALLSILWTALAWGQATTGFHRVDRAIARAYGSATAQVMPYATVHVTNTATGAVATIYSDPLLSHQIVSGTVTADANGNYDYYVALNYCVNEAVSAPGQGSYSTTNICQNGDTETVIQANGTSSDPLSPVNFVNSSSVNFSVSGNQMSATVADGAGMNIQHNSSASGIDQSLLNFCDDGTCGPSYDSGYQPVISKFDSVGGLIQETANATAQLTTFTSPPIAGQYVIVNPTAFTVSSCGTSNSASGDDKSGQVVMVGAGSCGNSSVTWTFNTSALTALGIPIANVTAVYPFVVSGSLITNTAGSGNTFDTDCTGTGVTLHNSRTDLGFNTSAAYPSQQYTSSTSLSVSAANFDAMTCSIAASMIDGAVGDPRTINGNATLVGAYVYYTGTPVTQPSQIYVPAPLLYNSSTSTLSLPLPYDTAVDFGTTDAYAVDNDAFTQAVSGLEVKFYALNNNTSSTPTLNVNGWGNWTIVGPSGGTLSANDIKQYASSHVVTSVMLGGNNEWFLENPQSSGSGAVSSVFGRIGAVVAATGDYSVSQVTGAAPTASPAFTGTPDASAAVQFKLPVSAGFATAANGEIGFDSTNLNWHVWNGADSILAPLAAGFVSGDCGEPTQTAGKWVTADSGTPCGTGTSFNLANGIVKGTGTGTTNSAAVAADIVNLFSACSGTQYLGADGACHTPSGGGGGGLCPAVNNQTGTAYTLVLSDGTTGGSACIGTVTVSNASIQTVTVPPNSSVAFPVPDEIDFIQLGAGQTCIAAGAGVTLNTPTSLCARAQNSTFGIRKIATNTWQVFGDTQ